TPNPGQDFRQHGDPTLMVDTHFEFPVFAGNKILGKPFVPEAVYDTSAQGYRTHRHAVQAVGPKPLAFMCPAHLSSSSCEQTVSREKTPRGSLPLYEHQAVRDHGFRIREALKHRQFS